MARKKQITLVSKKTVITKARAFELDPEKAYIIHLPTEIATEDLDRLKGWLKERGIEQVIYATTDYMQVTEVKK